VGAKIQNLFQIESLKFNIILGVLTGFPLYLFFMLNLFRQLFINKRKGIFSKNIELKLSKKKDAISIPNAITQPQKETLKIY
jgi:hypothetical protein